MLCYRQVEAFLEAKGGSGGTGGRYSSSDVRDLTALHSLGSHPLTLDLVCELSNEEPNAGAPPPGEEKSFLSLIPAFSTTPPFSSAAAAAADTSHALWMAGRPNRPTRAWVMACWLERAMKSGAGFSSRGGVESRIGGAVAGEREGGGAATGITTSAGVVLSSSSACGLHSAEDLAFSMYQAGRWTMDAAPPEMQSSAQLLQLRLHQLVPLSSGKLWGFAKSGLMEFLVASRVRRGVLQEGERRRERISGVTHNKEGVELAPDLPEPNPIMDALSFCPFGGEGGGGSGSVGHPGGGLVLAFLGEMCSTDPVFAELLLQLVDDSKHHVREITCAITYDHGSNSGSRTSKSAVSEDDIGSRHSSETVAADDGGDDASRNRALMVAAANAMTVLCRSGRSFAGMDLSQIKIPGAVLDRGIFDGCSFIAADLTGCSVREASLRRCNLARARLGGLNIGALPTLRPFGTGSSGGATLVPARGVGDARGVVEAAAAVVAGPRSGGGDNTRAGEEMIGRVGVSADRTVVAVLSGDGRCAKILRTGSLQEVCRMSSGTGRVFSSELLLLSPRGHLVLAYTVPVGGAGGEGGREESPRGSPESKYLELRRVVGLGEGNGGDGGGQEGEARLVFQEPCAPNTAHPSFFPDDTRFVHQHGDNDVGVIDCASGESVDMIRVDLSAMQEKQQPQQHGQEANSSIKREERGGTSAPAPSICSLRVTPDQTKVQVSISKGIILEYELERQASHEQAWLRVGYEALIGRRVVDAPVHGEGGLFAVMGPDRVIQIRSWRVKPSSKRSKGETPGEGSDEGCTVSERELARLRCGDEEKIEELAFASTGDSFLTRERESGTASLWSIKPDVALIQRMKNVCCHMTPELFLASGKALALSHNDCTVKVYSCETGEVLLSHCVPSPASWVAVTAAPTEQDGGDAGKRGGSGSRVSCRSGRCSPSDAILHAFTTAGQIHRWRLSLRKSIERDIPFSGASGADGGSRGPVRAAAALPAGCGGGGRHLIVLAGDRGLVTVDAERGEFVQDLTGAGGAHSGNGEGGGDSGGRGDGGGGVSHVVVTPDETTIVSVGDDNKLVEWDARTCAMRSSRQLDSEPREAAGCRRRTPWVERRACRQRRRPHRSMVVAMTLCSRGRIQLWDLATYRERCRAGAGRTASMSPSTSSFVTAEWIAHDGPVTSMAARPKVPKPSLLPSPSPAKGRGSGGRRGTGTGNGGDETTAADIIVGVDAHTHLLLSRRPPAVATGGGDGMVRIWTDEGMATCAEADGETLLSPEAGSGRSGHEGAVLCVRWHPGGEVLASAGQDWAIWLWSANGRALSYVHAHQRWTRVLSFSDGGDFLMSYAAGGGFAGWAVAVSEKKQEFKIRWKHPQRLIATHAELDDTLGLSAENAQALCDHGAVVSLPPPSTKSEPTPAAGLAGATTSASALATTSAIETPMLAVSATLHACIQDVYWTVDGVRSLAWPAGDHDLEARNSEGMTMLLSAARHGRGHMVDSFLSAGVNRNAVDDRGYTAVCWAAAGGFSTILHALLFSDEGANPNHVTSDGDTPAILAARGGHLCAIAELEKGGADLNMGNHPGETPLIAASRAGKTEVVAFLAGLTGTDHERRDGVGGTTALAAAASFGRTGCARVLLARGADLFVPATDGRAPVFLASSGGHLATLRLLLDATGADREMEIARPDSAGRTPVMAASANGHLGCLRALLGDDGGGGGGPEENGAEERQGCVPGIDAPDGQGRTALMHACMLGQTECVKYLLSKGARVDIGDNRETTPIMLAAGGGHESCLYILIEACSAAAATAAAATSDASASNPATPQSPAFYKADLLDVADADGNNASHYACRAGEDETLAILADAGACLELTSGASGTGGAGLRPVHLAVVHGFLFCLAELADRGVDLEATDGDEETPLSLAVRYGSEACAEFLLTEGTKEADSTEANGAAHTAGRPLVDPNRRSGGGGGGVGRERPLNTAARLGRTSLVLLLLSAGADPAATDRDGETAVHAAARCGQAGIIKALAQASGGRLPTRRPRVPAGVSGDESRNHNGDLPPWWFMVTDAGETATFAAAVEGHAGVLRSLLAVGALETSRPNAAGDTAMGAAALAGNSEALQVLVEAGGDVNDADEAGRTSAYSAAMSGHVSTLALIFGDADYNTGGECNSSGGRLRGKGAGGGKAALGNPAAVDTPDNNGSTPLWAAAARGHFDTVEYLVGRCGASAHARDARGTTAAWMAAESGHTRCLKVLLGEGADGSLANDDGFTPALIAAQGGHVECLRVLAMVGADLSITDPAGNSAAGLAAVGGHINCLEVITDTGGDLDVSNNDRHTAVFAAAMHGRLDCLRVLAAAGANLTRRDAAGNTAAMVAASHNQVCCLEFLVEQAGHSVLSEKNDHGMSPTCFALLCGSAETVDFLAAFDPGLMLDPDSNGWTLAHFAAAQGQLGCLKTIVEAYANKEALAGHVLGTDAAGRRGGTGGEGGGASSLLSDWWVNVMRGVGGGEARSASPSGSASEGSASEGSAPEERKRRLQGAFAARLEGHGESPLHAAARAGHLHTYAYLVEEVGLRPEDANSRGETCLWIAAANGRVEILRLLVKEGLDVNAPDHKGCSPAHAAARENQVDALTVLTERRCLRRAGGGSGRDLGSNSPVLDLDAKDSNGASPLHYAVAARHLSALAFLCDAGANVDAVDASGRTPCWQVAEDGERWSSEQAGLLDLLASRGADLNKSPEAGTTLAHIAALNDDSGCLKVLCERGADVDTVDQFGNTPIMFAATAGVVDSVQMLADRGCDLSRGNHQKDTPAFFSAQDGHTECLSLLLSLGADGGVGRVDRGTPLMIAAQNGHASCVEVLLSPSLCLLPSPSVSVATDAVFFRTLTPSNIVYDSIGASIGASSSTSSSASGGIGDGGGGIPRPHQMPADSPRAGLELRTSSGYTALSLAVVSREHSCAKALLAAGADVEAADPDGRTPLYLAAAAGDALMCGILLEHGALAWRRTADGLEPAMVAALRGHDSAARRIIEDARLTPGDGADVAGEAISRYRADARKRAGGASGSPLSRGVGGGGFGGGYNDGFERTEALLPASLARLPFALTSRRGEGPSSAAIQPGLGLTEEEGGAASSTGGNRSSGRRVAGRTRKKSNGHIDDEPSRAPRPIAAAVAAATAAIRVVVPSFMPTLNGSSTVVVGAGAAVDAGAGAGGTQSSLWSGLRREEKDGATSGVRQKNAYKEKRLQGKTPLRVKHQQ
ncbi:unnamed protein product [Ectocarpus sp. 4 AP-2014]